METTMSKYAFWGDTNADTAEAALAKAKMGSFIVRFSGSVPGAYTLSAKIRKGNVKHVRILWKKSRGLFWVAQDQPQFATLDLAVHFLRSHLGFVRPLKGGPYDSIFAACTGPSYAHVDRHYGIQE